MPRASAEDVGGILPQRKHQGKKHGGAKSIERKSRRGRGTGSPRPKIKFFIY